MNSGPSWRSVAHFFWQTDATYRITSYSHLNRPAAKYVSRRSLHSWWVIRSPVPQRPKNPAIASLNCDAARWTSLSGEAPSSVPRTSSGMTICQSLLSFVPGSFIKTGPLELAVNCFLLLAYFQYYKPFLVARAYAAPPPDWRHVLGVRLRERTDK